MCDTLVEQETQQITLSFRDFGQSYSGLLGNHIQGYQEKVQKILVKVIRS